jgi:hypothetical protein
MDESRDIPDEVYEVLVPSVIGAGGTAVISSTPGVMRGFYYELCTHPGPGTVLIESKENRNPYASAKVISFLRDRLRLWNAAAEQRELGGEFAEEGNAFLPWPLIQSVVDAHWIERTSSALAAYAGLDLSRKKDLTSLVVVLRHSARQPEAQDHLEVALIRLWDPTKEPTGDVPFDQVRAALLDVVTRFPNIKIAVDEGTEGGSILPWARGRMELVTRVIGFTATVDSNMQIWSSLAARLHSQTITLSPNDRLLAELRNLKQEPTMWGSKWRIVDSARKYHRDLSMALALACFTAGEIEAREPVRLWVLGDDPPTSEEQIQEAAEVDADSRRHLEMVAAMVKRQGVYFPSDEYGHPRHLRDGMEIIGGGDPSQNGGDAGPSYGWFRFPR